MATGVHHRATEYCLADLFGQQFDPIAYLVPGLIPAEGLTLLVGKPKIGKWFVLGLALAAPAGGEFLGKPVKQCGVLYYALEDNPRRMALRTEKLMGSDAKAWPRVQMRHALSAVDDVGLMEIESQLEANPDTALVIVDVLAKVRKPKGANEQPYQHDYRVLGKLQQLALKYHVAVVVVHHTRKAMGEQDPLDEVSGTTGIAGAADTIVVLGKNGQSQLRLYARGRDTEEADRLMAFDGAQWRVLGDTQDTPYEPEVPQSEIRQRIVAVVRAAGCRWGLWPSLRIPTNSAGYSGMMSATDSD